jgi:hypothetical protein
MVFFKNIAAGYIWLGRVLRFELRDINSGFAALNFFFENVNAHIIAPREPGPGAVHEHLNEAAPGRPITHLAGQFISKHIAHERLVRIRGVKHPIGIGRKAEELARVAVTVSIQELKRVRVFRVAEGGAAADVNPAGAREIYFCIEFYPASARIHDLNGAKDVVFVRDVRAERIQDYERQVGAE